MVCHIMKFGSNEEANQIEFSKMASETRKDGGDSEAVAGHRWMEMVKERWQATREHAETYPFVWASYILVYGGVGVYMTYRWRKLRKTEERVRALHEHLKKLVEADEAAASKSSMATAEGIAEKVEKGS
ncbi:hypothetical protein EJ110_NYTH26595 [Nymphaea thermarum]|nr:hypothetical protein EJ110_NYTH26595 [Nymphaea thermarum]